MMEENESKTSTWKYLLSPEVEAKKETGGSYQVLRRTSKSKKIHTGTPFTENVMTKPEKIKCPDCDVMFYPKTLLVHKRYFCNKEPPKNLEFKMLNNHLALCLKCKRKQHHESIILHSKYTCKNSYIRCFYCPAVFRGHSTKKSPLIHHIKNIHSKGMYEVNDLVSKLSPEDFCRDENGVVYTTFQASGAGTQVVDSGGYEESAAKKRFEKVLIKQEDVSSGVLIKQEELSFDNVLIKQEDINPPESVLIKQEPKEVSRTVNDSQFDLHYAYHNTSFPNVSNKEGFVPPERKQDTNREKFSICPKCSKLIYSSVKRLHKKYFCGKAPNDKLGWKIDESSTSGALCLKCGKAKIMPHLIEFHVAYICGKRPMSVQCFYCDEFYNNYYSLLNHMKWIHKRRHIKLDLLSVLPPAEDVDLEQEKDQSKEIKVYFGGFSNMLQNWNGPTFSGTEFGLAMYNCFYCNASSAYVFETLDHMEEEHSMKHNTYDVLRHNFGRF